MHRARTPLTPYDGSGVFAMQHECMAARRELCTDAPISCARATTVLTSRRCGSRYGHRQLAGAQAARAPHARPSWRCCPQARCRAGLRVAKIASCIATHTQRLSRPHSWISSTYDEGSSVGSGAGCPHRGLCHSRERTCGWIHTQRATGAPGLFAPRRCAALSIAASLGEEGGREARRADSLRTIQGREERTARRYEGLL